MCQVRVKQITFNLSWRYASVCFGVGFLCITVCKTVL